MSDVRWHELELVYEIAQAGSATAAARALGISQPTVSRRLAALEATLGVRLFDRQAQRLVPTAAGRELSAAAQRLSGQVHEVVRRIEGRDAEPGGPVIVTGLQPLLRALMPTFRRLIAEHGQLQLRLDSALTPANLHRQEADIAVRATSEPPPTLVGRQIGRIAYALYQRAADESVGPDVVGFPKPRGDIATRPWLSEVIPSPRVRVRIDHDELHLDAVRAGLGCAQLMCLLGDADPTLERVRGAPIEWGEPVWVLTHEAARSVRRVRVVYDALVADLGTLAAALRGERPVASSAD